MLMLAMGCGGNTPKKNDSVESAEKANEQKMDNTANEKKEDDANFAVEAANGGMFEVKMGEYAAKNAHDAAIRKLGQMMVDDHSKLNEELRGLCAKKNITLPDHMDGSMQETYDKLISYKGHEFDKEYSDEMVSDHKKDIDKFEKESKDGNDSDLRKWAEDKLPTLRHHLEMSKRDEKMEDKKK